MPGVTPESNFVHFLDKTHVQKMDGKKIPGICGVVSGSTTRLSQNTPQKRPKTAKSQRSPHDIFFALKQQPTE
jgi:hypothetical protein